MRKLLLLALLLLFVLVMSVGQVPSEVGVIKSVTVLESAPLLNEKVELVAEIDAKFTNPYDPTDIRVDGQFYAPSGSVITVPGFYYRDYQEDSADTLTPTDDWSWRVRFTPTEVGDYRYAVLLTTAKGSVNSEIGTFTVATSDNPGFVRLDPRNPRFFAFDNGTPYFPIGEDMGWSDNPNPLPDYQKWLGLLHAAGGNFVRVWMAPWSFDLEWTDTGLGNYDNRQEQAFELDRVMDMLDQDHIYMMLSLINHGQFSTTTNAQWDQNPFNAANAGPCGEPACFATDPTALQYWNDRLRYIAARWGYSTNIMAWEWWNEVNSTPLYPSKILAPWIAQSGAYLRSLDPYHHLITHDGSPANASAIWNQPTIDFTQDHLYNMQNLLLSFQDDVTHWVNQYPDKPFLVGEFGDPLAIDNQGVFLHLGLWSAPMNGASGSGMSWYWDDYVDRLNLYDQFSGIAAFFKGEDMAARQWQTTTATFARQTSANVYGVQADDYALLWVVNPAYGNSTLKTQYNDALRQAIVGRNRLHPLYSFEDGLDGWALDTSADAGTGIATSTDQASDGSSSLAVSLDFAGGNPQIATTFVRLDDADWSAHNGLRIDIYDPAEAANVLAQVYIKTGSAETQTNSLHVSLTPGQWNHINFDFSPAPDLNDVRELGVTLRSNVTVFDGPFYIDRVIFNDQPDVKFSFPDLSREVLNLTGLKPGGYNAEVWDTMKGTFISTMPLNTSDGKLQITLPTFNTDLAIKVKPQ